MFFLWISTVSYANKMQFIWQSLDNNAKKPTTSPSEDSEGFATLRSKAFGNSLVDGLSIDENFRQIWHGVKNNNPYNTGCSEFPLPMLVKKWERLSIPAKFTEKKGS